MANPDRRHDEKNLVVLLPPHRAILVPESYVSEHGRIDVVPSLDVGDNDDAVVLNMNALWDLWDKEGPLD